MSKSMMAVRVQQPLQDGGVLPSFKLIPITNDCPYVACAWEATNGRFILLHKDQKPDIETVPKIDQYGSPIQKNGSYVVERRNIVNYFETHILDKESIVDFINAMAVNADNQALYMPHIAEIQPIKAGFETPGSVITKDTRLVDSTGAVIN